MVYPVYRTDAYTLIQGTAGTLTSDNDHSILFLPVYTRGVPKVTRLPKLKKNCSS